MTMAVAERPKTKRAPAKFESARTDRIRDTEGRVISLPSGPPQSREFIWATEISSTAWTGFSAVTEPTRDFTSASTVAHSNPFLSGKFNQAPYPEALWQQYTVSTGPVIYGSVFASSAPMYYGVSAINPAINNLPFMADVQIFDQSGVVPGFELPHPIELPVPIELPRPIELELSRQIDLEVSRQIDLIFSRGKEERFEDGMESEFTRSLAAAIEKYSFLALLQIAKLVSNATSNPEVIGEALRLLGRLQDSSTHDFRLGVLESALSSSHPSIRDAASLGLASMDDPRSIEHLVKAVSLEPIAELKADMQSVVDQLRSTR
ncbi:MAG: HEAT repeat domain-containing protein [Tepidisphaeraceae bacterium]|jgi:hypothetical protein